MKKMRILLSCFQEFEESEKMDEDSKVIEELRQNSEYQQAQILHLEKSLKQAVASLEAIKISNDSELKKSKETVDELNKKVASCLNTIEAKNIEVLNLQTALGQYYAEIEAKVNSIQSSPLHLTDCGLGQTHVRGLG